jgi:hypothetical protein
MAAKSGLRGAFGLAMLNQQPEFKIARFGPNTAEDILHVHPGETQ